MTKSDMKDAWSKVGDELSGLGLKLKYHAQEEFSHEDEEDELKSALKRLGDAIEDAADAVGSAVTDPAVREDVRDAGRLLMKAVSVSMGEARQALKKQPEKSDT